MIKLETVEIIIIHVYATALSTGNCMKRALIKKIAQDRPPPPNIIYWFYFPSLVIGDSRKSPTNIPVYVMFTGV